MTCLSPLLLKTAGGLYSTLVCFGFFRVLAHLGLIYGHISNFWYSMDLYRYCAPNFNSFGPKEMVLRNFQVNDLRILAWLIEFSPLGNTKSAKKWQFLEWFSIFRILSCSYMVIYVKFCVLKTFAVILRQLQKNRPTKRCHVNFIAYIRV